MPAYGDTGHGTAYNAYARLSKQIRHASQAMNPYGPYVSDESDNAMGGMKSDTLYITRSYDTNLSYPTAPLAEKSRIPATEFTQDSITLTLKEWGQRIDITQKELKLSDFDEKSKNQRKLRDQWARWLSALFVNKAKQTAIKYVPVSGTTSTLTAWYATPANWTATVTSGEAFTTTIDGTDPGAASRIIGEPDLWNLRALAVDFFRIPPITGEMSEYGEFVLVVNQTIANNLMRNSAIANALNASYQGRSRENPLIRGWMGNYAGIGIKLDNQNLTGTTAATCEALFYGDDAVVQAWATYPELRWSDGYDFGRDQGAAWYALGNYKFVGSTTAATTRAFMGRCIHITEAASPTPTEDSLS